MGQIFVAIGIGIATVLAALWVWLRPIYLQTLKAQADVEAAEKRIQQETDFQRNAILLEAKESALKIREQTEAEAGVSEAGPIQSAQQRPVGLFARQKRNSRSPRV